MIEFLLYILGVAIGLGIGFALTYLLNKLRGD